jgi:hypothetical protein
MTARTSPETRAELARLLDAAEPLPWRVHRDPDLAHTWWIVSGDRHLMEAGAVYATAAANALPDLLADLTDAEAEQESLTAERDELRAGAQADAWLGESVARLLTAETARGRSERDALAAKLDRVRALAHESDDGTEWEHVPDCQGEPTCPACWTAAIRRYLDESEG